MVGYSLQHTADVSFFYNADDVIHETFNLRFMGDNNRLLQVEAF